MDCGKYGLDNYRPLEKPRAGNAIGGKKRVRPTPNHNAAVMHTKRFLAKSSILFWRLVSRIASKSGFPIISNLARRRPGNKRLPGLGWGNQLARGFIPPFVLLMMTACGDTGDLLSGGGIPVNFFPKGFIQVKSPSTMNWFDDGNKKSMLRAVNNSIDYYLRLTSSDTFQYGHLVYTPREMVASMKLFRQEFQTAQSPLALSARIAERFHFFESVRPGGTEANLFTGYYEPEFPASKRRRGKLRTPIYAYPRDMVKIRLEPFRKDLPSITLTGRVKKGELVPYFTRREIQGKNVLARQAKVIAYMDQVDLFFLQVQGSGMLRFRNGRKIKVGYASGNGHTYESIGALMVRRNYLELDQVSLQSIRAFLSANPKRVREILYSNPSYVFFQVQNDGPLGSIRVPLTAGRSIAADWELIPKGGLAHVTTASTVPFDTKETVPLRRFMVVQDTGGAIKGQGRVDLFWGNGKKAEWRAGHQRSAGRVFYLVAKKEFLGDATEVQ